jgi:hypothetical protein
MKLYTFKGIGKLQFVVVAESDPGATCPAHPANIYSAASVSALFRGRFHVVNEEHPVPIARLWLMLIFLTATVSILATTGALAPQAALAAAKDDDDKEASAKKESATLGAVGGLSVISANSTFLLIGVTADAFAKDVYGPEQVRGIMKPIIKQLDAVSNLLRKVQDEGLGEQDDDFIDQIVELYRLLQDEARALDKYVVKKGEPEAKAFEKARKAALKALGKLTGEDKKEDDEKEDDEKEDEDEDEKKEE